MTEKIKTLAFLIKKNPSGEKDENFVFFTRDFGKIEVLGRSIRKIESKLRMQSQLFNFLEIEFVQGRYQKILTDVFLISSFPKTKKYLYKVKYFYFISQKIDELIFGPEKDERIFDLLKEVFEKIENSFVLKKISLYYLYFFWRFIFFLGWATDFYYCGSCQQRFKEGSVFLVEKENRFFCEKCYKKSDGQIYPVSSNLLKVIYLIFQMSDFLDKIYINEGLIKDLFSFSEFYYLSLKKNQL